MLPSHRTKQISWWKDRAISTKSEFGTNFPRNQVRSCSTNKNAKFMYNKDLYQENLPLISGWFGLQKEIIEF